MPELKVKIIVIGARLNEGELHPVNGDTRRHGGDFASINHRVIIRAVKCDGERRRMRGAALIGDLTLQGEHFGLISMEAGERRRIGGKGPGPRGGVEGDRPPFNAVLGDGVGEVRGRPCRRRDCRRIAAFAAEDRIFRRAGAVLGFLIIGIINTEIAAHARRVARHIGGIVNGEVSIRPAGEVMAGAIQSSGIRCLWGPSLSAVIAFLSSVEHFHSRP